MFRKYVTLPGGEGITKELQPRGHRHGAERTAAIFGFARASVKVLFDWDPPIIGLQRAQDKLNKRANPETDQ